MKLLYLEPFRKSIMNQLACIITQRHCTLLVPWLPCFQGTVCRSGGSAPLGAKRWLSRSRAQRLRETWEGLRCCHRIWATCKHVAVLPKGQPRILIFNRVSTLVKRIRLTSNEWWLTCLTDSDAWSLIKQQVGHIIHTPRWFDQVVATSSRNM